MIIIMGLLNAIWNLKDKRLLRVEEYANKLIAEGNLILKEPNTVDRDNDGYVDVQEMLRYLFKKLIYSRM